MDFCEVEIPKKIVQSSRGTPPKMKNIPFITGAIGLLLLCIALFGLFASRVSQNDGALLIAGAILFSAALIHRR